VQLHVGGSQIAELSGPACIAYANAGVAFELQSSSKLSPQLVYGEWCRAYRFDLARFLAQSVQARLKSELGLPDRGTLAPGQRADVVLCDLADPRLGAPLAEWQRDVATAIAGAMVFAADERWLTDVVCGGRFVVRGGRPDWDWRDLADDVAATLPDVLRRAGLAR